MNQLERLEHKIDELIAIRTAPRWLSINIACQYISMSKHTLMAYIEKGDVYATRKGGKWYVDRESIDKFMEHDDLFIKATLDSFRRSL